MKTLYESILGSTKSGKKSKITEKYLLEKGFQRTNSGFGMIYFEIVLSGVHYSIYTHKDKFYVKIPRMDRNIFQYTKHFVETYNDLDLLMDYWKAVSEKLPLTVVKEKKEIVKNTLKRF